LALPRLGDEQLRQEVESLNNAPPFSASLPAEERASHAAVMSFLAGELPPACEVSELDRRDVEVGHDHRFGEFRFDENAVERTLVGVEREDRLRLVRVRRVPLEDEDGAILVEAELLDPTAGEYGGANRRDAGRGRPTRCSGGIAGGGRCRR